MMIPDIRRVWAKIEQRTDGCWIWTGCVDQDGYGLVGYDARFYRATRFIYEWLVAFIPDGLQLDHLCRVRRCVNPTHLEPVTAHENWQRGNAPSAIHARKTHCIHGHPFDAKNTYLRPNGDGRACRRCDAERHMARKMLLDDSDQAA